MGEVAEVEHVEGVTSLFLRGLADEVAVVGEGEEVDE